MTKDVKRPRIGTRGSFWLAALFLGVGVVFDFAGYNAVPFYAAGAAFWAANSIHERLDNIEAEIKDGKGKAR